MNKKKLILSALLLTTAIAQPFAVEKPFVINEARQTAQDNCVQPLSSWYKQLNNFSHFSDYCFKTFSLGGLAGLFTGGSIAYLSSTIIDSAITPEHAMAYFAPNTIERTYYDDTHYINLAQCTGNQSLIPLAITLCRLGLKIGCKKIWEEPTQEKVVQRMVDALKKYNVDFDPKTLRTCARISSWIATVAA